VFPEIAGGVAGKWRSCSNPQILKTTRKLLGEQTGFARAQRRPAGGSSEKQETKKAPKFSPRKHLKG